mmetsp:Transcript_111170/g.279580  ORF Transcript_111170/g.279580 Transcript_111170/m.279580 type:complete len:266 (-) Transcript_111170:757-1554(-)
MLRSSTSEVEGHLLRIERAIGSGSQCLWLVRAVPDHYMALEDHSLCKDNLSLDREAAALKKGWRSLRHDLLHGVHKLVPAIQLDVGRHALALRGQGDTEVLGQRVGVRPECQQVVGRLHRCETLPRDDDGGGALEARDGSTHRRLKLKHRLRLLVAGVHRLGVLHHRQRDRAAVLLEDALQGDEVHPKVVRVEVLVLGHVLECLLVFFRALRGLTEQQATCLRVLGQVATLLVSVGAGRDLHHERRLALREVSQQLQVHGRPEVV